MDSEGRKVGMGWERKDPNCVSEHKRSMKRKRIRGCSVCFGIEIDEKRKKLLEEEGGEGGEARFWLWIGAKPDKTLGQDSIEKKKPVTVLLGSRVWQKMRGLCSCPVANRENPAG